MSSRKIPSVWSSNLVCYWMAWRVGGEYHLVLEVPDGQCPDMTATVNTAKAMNPNVRKIDVYSGGILDSSFVLFDGDEWMAMCYQP